jgi:hypothetical protein
MQTGRATVSHISVFFAILMVTARCVALVISWFVEAARERARARSVAALLAAARPGTTVIERNADGSLVVLSTAGGSRAPRSLPAGSAPAGEDRKDRV